MVISLKEIEVSECNVPPGISLMEIRLISFSSRVRNFRYGCIDPAHSSSTYVLPEPKT